MKNDKSDKLHNLRHSLAHILASAVVEMFPKAQLGVGPVIEHGFFYDFLLPRPLTPEDIKKLEKRMRELVKQKLEFERNELTTHEAKAYFTEHNQPFKIELIKDIEKFGTTAADEILNSDSKISEPKSDSDKIEKVSLYKTGKFTDLCRGGHVKNTSEVDPQSFKLDKISGAYWRGDQANAQMQRIYGLAFEKKEELEEYLLQREEAEKRDHKKLGQMLDLFVFSDLVGPGLPLWTPKGTLVRELLDNFVWELRRARGYQKVEIPHITKKDLYQTSGHWDKFKEELFRINTREKHEFAMKPMNCPHHTQIYARKLWSYRELPQRYCNTTMCYRDEQTGELSGLSRLRSFTQDDAHVFCRMSQAKEEFLKVWDIVYAFYGAFGFKLRVRRSLHDPKHPEKYLGDENSWKQTEDMLGEIVKSKKVDYFDGIGEAAFYGPKLDFMAKDSIGREWQVATIQIDMNMPERFDLVCINEKGERERIVMLHAAIMGSIERFMSILIEHLAGNFPTWLSPIQVAILPITDKSNKYATKILEEIQELGIRTQFDDRTESIGKKIRDSELQKIPYMLIIGEKEMAAKKVAVRARNQKDLGSMTLNKFKDTIVTEILGKKL
ncbi:MAG: threonine--tRNA ligase [Candidatus Doudnabacteria bacterium]|nr:threonine--tRNA ligase [Candidatus Doudnabacteria bacterium]